MLSRALGGKRKRGKERVTHRNSAKKYFLCTSKRHFNVSQSFSLTFCTCLSHKRKLLVCKSQLLFSVGFEIITKIEGAIFFETSGTCIKTKEKWVGHLSRSRDSRWTERTTHWTPRDMKRTLKTTWKMERLSRPILRHLLDENSKRQGQTEGYILHDLDR